MNKVEELIEMIENETERKAILRMMFGESADYVEEYLQEVLQAWGLRLKKDPQSKN